MRGGQRPVVFERHSSRSSSRASRQHRQHGHAHARGGWRSCDGRRPFPRAWLGRPLNVTHSALAVARGPPCGCRRANDVEVGGAWPSPHPFLPPVLFVLAGFLQNAIAYQPRTLWWGIHYVLPWHSICPASDHAPVHRCRIRHARALLIMGASLGLGVWGRWSKRSPSRVAALAFAVFLFLAPGIESAVTWYF